MTKVKMKLANGYLVCPVRQAVEDNSLVSPIEAVTAWIRGRYGAWIENTLGTTNYIIGDVDYWHRHEQDFGGSFTVTFDNPNHEDEFVKALGGKIVPLEAE